MGLVNRVNRRLNEVELTSSDFETAPGLYAQIKDAVNYAIRDLNQDEYEWPFNHTTASQVITPGTLRYAFPSNFKTCSMDTFRIARDDTLGNETRWLKPLNYEDFMRNFVDQEYNTSDTGIRDLPEFVTKTPSLEFMVGPSPDKAYTLWYEHYQIPDDLEASTDVPTLPFSFAKTITDGAMYYTYLFKEDYEAADRSLQKFDRGVKQLRSLYINRQEYIKSTMIERNTRYNGFTIGGST